jgi:hypothetical protein
MMILFPYVLAGIGFGVLAVLLAGVLIASVVTLTGRVIISLIWVGQLLGSFRGSISRVRKVFENTFNQLLSTA